MRTLLKLAAAGSLALTGGMVAAAAAVQESASELRATGLVGERYDGYLGLVAAAPGHIRAQVDAINIRRRAHYTNLASRRGVRVEEAAVAAACEIFESRILSGQYYLLPDNEWRQRRGNEPVPRPTYCR